MPGILSKAKTGEREGNLLFYSLRIKLIACSKIRRRPNIIRGNNAIFAMFATIHINNLDCLPIFFCLT